MTVSAGYGRAAVIKADSPLTIGRIGVSSGCLVKRGAGDLVLDPGSGTFTLSWDEGKTDGRAWGPTNRVEFSNDGGSPSDGFGGFSIAEGSLVLKGSRDTVFNIPNTTMIGLRTTEIAVQPRLVVDGACANVALSRKMNIGALLQDGDGVSAPALVVTNGAKLAVGTFVAGRNAEKASAPVISVDGSVFECASLYAGYHPNCQPSYLLANGAELYAGEVLCYGPSWFSVTNAVFAKNNARECTPVEIHTWGGEWFFGEGGVFCCDQIKAININTPEKNLVLSFDGGLWAMGEGVKVANAERVTVRTSGAGGLTIPVPEGQTVRMAHPVYGSGSVVKTGEGTLRFETAETWSDDLTEASKMPMSTTFAFDGVCDVRAGSLEIANGALKDGACIKAAVGASVDFGGAVVSATISGGGAFGNAVCSPLTIQTAIDGEGTAATLPVLDGSSIIGTVRIDLGRDAHDPLDMNRTYVVARYTGSVPDVGSWRVKNTGLSGVGGVFAASNGEIRLRLEPKGLIININ